MEDKKAVKTGIDIIEVFVKLKFGIKLTEKEEAVYIEELGNNQIATNVK